MSLHFIIDKQELIRKDKKVIASYSKNFLKCKFCCPKQWSDLYKYALFINVKGKESIVELGIGEKVSCIIPEEILTGNFFYVSIFADDRLTTTQQMVLIQPSGLTNNIINSFEDGTATIIDDDIETARRIELCGCGYRYHYDPEHFYF